MTRDEFMQQYAEGSDSTPEKLAALGLIALRCACGEGSCKGWRVDDKRHIVWLAEHHTLDKITCPLLCKEDVELVKSFLPEFYWDQLPELEL